MAIIEVSAGHYPDKPGASYSGFSEHQEALLWATLVRDKIGSMAGLVPVGRLSEKVAHINSQKECHLAVEIHFNSAKDADGNHIGDGSETLYHPKSTTGHNAALIVQRHLSSVCGPNRGARPGWYQGDPEKGAIYFLDKTRVPALIIEPEFIHRLDEIVPVREDACEAIAAALVEIVQQL